MSAWYKRYLKTDHWKKTRIKRLLEAETEGTYIRCEAEDCRLWVPLSAIDVHHKTYERLKCERMSDLAVWCRSCHAAHHGYARPLWWEAATKSGSEILRRLQPT